jgi:hypothetical protein
MALPSILNMALYELLIVDDDADTVRTLERRFRQIFGDLLKIWVAHTSEQGATMIRRRNCKLDAAILDFYLPSDLRPALAIDDSLCQLISKLSPETVVFHYTGFSKDPLVLEHQQKFHREGALRFYSKLPFAGYAGALRKDAARMLFSKHVSRILESLFGPLESEYIPRTANHGPVDNQDVFVSGMELKQAIERGWNYLDPDLYSRAKRSLHTDHFSVPPSVTLINTRTLRLELSRIERIGCFELMSWPLSHGNDAIDARALEVYRSALARFAAGNALSDLNGNPIPVFVHHIGSVFPHHDQSFTALDWDGRPYIVLPVWQPERLHPEYVADCLRFAVRESTRALLLSCFGDKIPPCEWWWWINAVSESDCAAELRANGFEPPPTRRPNHSSVSMDHQTQVREASLFIDFIRLSQGRWYPNLMHDLALLAATCPSPWIALETILGDSFDKGVELFAEFARHAYFLGDPQSFLNHWAGLGRVPNEVCILGNQTTVDFSGKLDHLGCIYYQLEADALEGLVEVSVTSSHPCATSALRVQLCPQNEHGLWTKTYLFDIVTYGASLPKKWLHNPVILERQFDPEGTTYGGKWILIVSNCGVSKEADGIEFTVSPRLFAVGQETV